MLYAHISMQKNLQKKFKAHSEPPDMQNNLQKKSPAIFEPYTGQMSKFPAPAAGQDVKICKKITKKPAAIFRYSKTVFLHIICNRKFGPIITC